MLHTTQVKPGAVRLAWSPAAHAKRYVVQRDRRRIGVTTKLSFTDRRMRAGRKHRYRVRAIGTGDARGPWSRELHVSVPRQPAPGGGIPSKLATPHVDRLFWRAGFGPTEAERSAWVGKKPSDLVDFLLTQPQSYRPTSTPPVTQTNGSIDPLVDDNDLVMEWLDAMMRAVNPLAERLTLFWHRHFAISRDNGIPAEWMIGYRNRLRRFGDVGRHPHASFRQLAHEMTTKDPAMSLWLNLWENTRGDPNENYARELMELFCLGVRDGAGKPTYTQHDVQELARALTGWRLNQQPADPAFGAVTFGGPSYFDTNSKTIFGKTANWSAIAGTPAGSKSAVDLVLSRPSHAPFLIRKLWKEFIVAPIPAKTLADLIAAYTRNNALEIKPVIRRILEHPLIFESIHEPNLVKPPIVYTVGVQRLMGGPLKWYHQASMLDGMQQRPYHPPNVSGWEGGLSWLNTNAAAARFQLVKESQYVKHKSYPGAKGVADVPGETADQAYDRAYAAVNRPWLSSGTKNALRQFSAAQPAGNPTQRAQRQYALRALILAGPDGQVM
jgi:uncharacterized protein (DUF1800 family)